MKRHLPQDELDTMLKKAEIREAKGEIKTPLHLSERSFARSMRYGSNRARWPRVWRAQTRNSLIYAIQDIMVLITQSQGKISKSNPPIGHAIQPQETTCSQFSLDSNLLPEIKTASYAWLFISNHAHLLLLVRYKHYLPVAYSPYGP